MCGIEEAYDAASPTPQMNPRVSFLAAAMGLLIGVAAPPGERAEGSSAAAVTSDGKRVLAVNPDSRSVTVFEAATLRLLAEIDVGPGPQAVAGDPIAGRAYVVGHEGIRVVELERLAVVGSARIAGGASSVVIAGGRLYVSATASSEVVVLDRVTLAEVRRVRTEEYPKGLTVDAERRLLYATHFRSGRLTVIDLDSLTVQRVISPGLDHNLSQTVVLDSLRSRLYLPQTRSNSANQALLFDTTVFPVVAVIDAATGANLPRERISLDVADRPVNMPLDAVLTARGSLYVANAGSDDVSVIDLATRRGVANIAVGSNPRGIALSPDEATVYVNNVLSGTLSVIDTATNAVRSTVRTTTIPLPRHILNGKVLFNTSARPSIARDRWISCATCHFDGGTDGRTWFFRDGPRNTPPIFGIAETLPMHWSGDLDELQDVESTVRTIQAGSGLAEGDSRCDPACDLALPNAGRSADLDDLAAFMRSAAAPPAGMQVESASANRGAALFHDAGVGCASCHSSPLFTDRRKHDVGTGRGPHERKGTSFDTPSLRGVFDTAPYFHDGSAATLLDVVNGATGQHGNTTALRDDERRDLVEFLRSLDFPRPRLRAVAH